MASILIVEDSADLCALLERVFQRAGFTVLTAADGAVALEIAVQQRPDVVLTDLDMPQMNGLDLCRAIRGHPEIRDVPVAILSGSLQHGDPRAAEVTACGVLLKPFANNDLVAAVQALIDHGHHDHTAGTSTCPLEALTNH